MSAAAQKRLDATLSALADPTRRRVVDLLRVRPRRAGELVAALELHTDGVLVLAEGEPLRPVALNSPLPQGGVRVVLVASGG